MRVCNSRTSGEMIVVGGKVGGWLGLSLRTPSDLWHELGIREDAQPRSPHIRERS